MFLTGQEEVDDLVRRIEDYPDQKLAQQLLTLPIYAGLPNDQQKVVFERPPKGMRKVVVATNIAESSITIEGIVYVIDSGFVKIRAYNPKTGTDTLVVVPTSKASAQQRAGRAGRVRPGKAFRLFTEEDFLKLPTNSIPEIQRSSLSPVILQLKALGIDNIARFDFMSPPPANVLIRALEHLYALGALNDRGLLTSDIGMKIAELPFDPPVSRMILASGELGCSEEIASIAAMMGVQNAWVNPSSLRKKADEAKLEFGARQGDHITLLNGTRQSPPLIPSFLTHPFFLVVYANFVANKESSKWCYENFLNYRSLQRAITVRKQVVGFMKRFKVPLVSCEGDVTLIQKCIAVGFFANAARRSPDGQYRTLRDSLVLAIHPTSILFNYSPEWVVFQEVVETTNIFMRDLTVIEQMWLPEIA